MSDFGDMTPEDAIDTADPDIEVLARRWTTFQNRIDSNRPTYDTLHEQERVMLLYCIADLVDRLKREWRPSG